MLLRRGFFPRESIAVMVHAPVKVITVEREYGSCGLYHMLLNSCIGTEAMIDAVQCAAGLRAAAPESVAR